MSEYPFIPLDFKPMPEAEMKAKAESFYDMIKRRRTVRDFSSKPVPRAVIEHALKAAGTAPSGANKQPWHFVVISDAETKREIRLAAEEEERQFYSERATEEWLEDLAPLGTDDKKPFLETAPYLIAIFLQKFEYDEDGTKHKNYYTAESVGLASGFLIAALHQAGLATLTHTPSPMKFLNKICKRPEYERPYILLVVGYPEEDAQVPDITKKPLGEFTSFIE
ncbi:nitroreductase family protein [Pseudoteredinibacter isoporae]|uniref:nitroreductase family protein n=1 Tax=Pseudoteredinibacter isoporae TaxID=570281 RepID=UPI00310C09B2